MYQINSPHSFHIPVMGTGFTIDTPLFVAKYGISSVVSLVDDALIEQMRRYWCGKSGEHYEEISSRDIDARAKRITAYLNLVQELIDKQVIEIKASSFEQNGEINSYFEMLPRGNLRQAYENMLVEKDISKKTMLQEQLRQAIVSGSVDVNIMTKLDCQNYHGGELLPYDFCDAAAALRGYAKSNLCSTIVFSAGFNPHLYGYLAKFDDFFPDENYNIKKKICLKVSDYRSAAIQGKYLAKHGIWVSEYRIESPLNCGGHAFINDGQLMGPILEEFKQHKDELAESLHLHYKRALQSIGRLATDLPQKVRVTAQGGVGTNSEHEFLIKHYKVDAVGWGTPFLLVPEATNVDEATLSRLIAAKEDDVYLSSSSPLGVPFWNLKNSLSEEARKERISKCVPGSFCVKGYIKSSQEFTQKPICRASREYQKLKLQQLANIEEVEAVKQEVLSKSCICHELGGGALIKNKIDTNMASAVCPGPNIVHFKKLMTLKEMVGHIYGRCSLLASDDRPHMFIRETQIQINYLVNEIKNASAGLPARSQQKLAEVKETISNGINYYRKLVTEVIKEQQEKFLFSLQKLQNEVDSISVDFE